MNPTPFHHSYHRKRINKKMRIAKREAEISLYRKSKEEKETKIATLQTNLN